MKKLKVVYCGTPDFSVPTLKALFNNQFVDLKYVISMPSRPKGRGMDLHDPEVISFAKENNIQYFQTENINKETEFLDTLENDPPDIFIVLAFAQFLGNRVLNLPKMGCFNIHTSILPKYRGAAPIQYALLNGDSSTGVSIQKMVKEMDAGDLVYFSEVEIAEDETGGSLYNKLKEEAGISTDAFIQLVYKDKITYTPQDESLVTFAPTLKREDGQLNFALEKVDQIERRVRALFPWPGTFTFLNGKRLKVFATEIVSTPTEPGLINTTFGTLIVGCQDGSIRLTEVQLEGKKRSTDKDLLNGLKNKTTEFKIEGKS